MSKIANKKKFTDYGRPCVVQETPEPVGHLPTDHVGSDTEVDRLAVQEGSGVGPAVGKHVIVVQPISWKSIF